MQHVQQHSDTIMLTRCSISVSVDVFASPADNFMILPRFSREKVIPGTGDQKMSRSLRSQ